MTAPAAAAQQHYILVHAEPAADGSFRVVPLPFSTTTRRSGLPCTVLTAVPAGGAHLLPAITVRLDDTGNIIERVPPSALNLRLITEQQYMEAQHA